MGIAIGFNSLYSLWAPVAGIAYGIFANRGAFAHKPLEAIATYAGLGLDYAGSLVMNPIMGDPLPYIKHIAGGDIIYNSFYANYLNEPSVAASTRGTVIHSKTGIGDNTILHESQHTRQFYLGYTSYPDWSGKKPYETDAEFHSGTDSYLTYTTLFIAGVISEEQHREITYINLWNNRGIPYRLLANLLVADAWGWSVPLKLETLFYIPVEIISLYSLGVIPPRAEWGL